MIGSAWLHRLVRLGLALLGLLLVMTALASLRWRFQHDSPILLYIAFLIDRFGLVPYRDLFDMNMPGTYLAYGLIGKLSGYRDIGVRCADLAILASMLGMTWFWMRRLGRLSAWSGPILWGLMYLAAGPMTSLQREYLLLLPIVAALVAHSCLETRPPRWQWAAVGLGFGVAATMKPQAAVGFPVLLLFHLREAWRNGADPPSGMRGRLNSALPPALLGFAAPVSCAMAYLWGTGALPSFLDMVTNYLPLYGSLSGWHETLSGLRRVSYMAENYRLLGGYALWIAPAAVGACVALHGSTLAEGGRRQVRLLLGLTVAYSVYPVFSGQFWPYHWLPFVFFLLQLASLCLAARPAAAPASFPAAVLALAVALALPFGALRDALTLPPAPPLAGRVDEMAGFLKGNLRPGDTVQPLDWTGGAVHAMLISGARISTPFLYDFHFYHHVSRAYIRGLRGRFLAEMARARPRFVVSVHGNDKPWVWGADTTRDFPELQSLLGAGYRIAYPGYGYDIYERLGP